MDSYLSMVNRLVARFDKNFFAKRSNDGVVRVYCNKYSLKPVVIDDETTIYYPDNHPYHIFSSTDTWGYWGSPVTYGSLPLWDKLRQLSFDNLDKIHREIAESQARAQTEKKRARARLVDDMAHEACDVFKEATKDVVFSTIDKTNDPRRKQEKKIKEI